MYLFLKSYWLVFIMVYSVVGADAVMRGQTGMLSDNFGRSQGIHNMPSAFTKSYDYGVGQCRSNKAL